MLNTVTTTMAFILERLPVDVLMQKKMYFSKNSEMCTLS